MKIKKYNSKKYFLVLCSFIVYNLIMLEKVKNKNQLKEFLITFYDLIKQLCMLFIHIKYLLINSIKYIKIYYFLFKNSFF